MRDALPLIIINPAARGGAGGREWRHAASTVQAHLGPFACAFTEGPLDATRIAREAAADGRKLIVAFGGDGTMSEVASGILAAGGVAELGLLPSGTGADFHRTIGVPRRMADAAHALRHGAPRRFDAGQATFRTFRGEQDCRVFVNSCSFGLSGEVARDVNRSAKRLGGRVGFLASTLRAAFRFDPPEIRLSIDEEEPRRIRITDVAVNNGRYFGGGMKIAPLADPADGRFDLVIIGKHSFAQILANSPRLYTGTHLHLPGVRHRLATTVSAEAVDARREILIELDGEIPGRLPVKLTVRPAALTVRVPRTA